MRAIAIGGYGGPDQLVETDLPGPPVAPDTVLVRVRAAGVNPVDAAIREGHLDGMFPVHFPLVPGWDAAGVVEAVGPAVTAFEVGDEVFGYVRRDDIQHGTYAELVPAPERTLADKPVRATWTEAGGLPLAGLTAYQALQAIRVGDGDTVLVHAAAGGVGHLAVQLARAFGAERVIGTASEANHDFVRSLGAEPVPYGEGLAERVRALAPEGVDAILDIFGGDGLAASVELLTDPERLASIADPVAVTDLGGVYIFVKPSAADLTVLAGLIDADRLTVHVAETFPLSRAADAHRRVAEGHGRGKLVLEI